MQNFSRVIASLRLVNIATYTTSSLIRSSLEGKVAIVTASTEGIGFAVAERLAANGASVVISSRKQNNVNNAVDKLKAAGYSVSGVVCHVAKAEERAYLIKEALDKFGGIDILVSNAAVNPAVKPTLQTSEDAWDKIFEVNVKAAYLISKEVLPHIRKRKGGSIVYVSSISGYTPFETIGAYSVSKTALLGLTKAVAVELGPENIRVNCVAPGPIITRFSELLRSNDEAEKHTIDLVPLKRLGLPHEISGVVAFLVSDEASYITGETIVAAGGGNTDDTRAWSTSEMRWRGEAREPGLPSVPSERTNTTF